MAGKKKVASKKTVSPLRLDDPAARGKALQWHTQEEWIAELEKEGFTEFYSRPTKEGRLPRGTKGPKSEIGKLLKRIFPGSDGGPDLVAIDRKGKRILVGDITAKSSSTAKITRPDRVRKMPNDLAAEDAVHHLDKTKHDAEILSEALPEEFKDFELHFQDRYAEDTKRKASKRFRIRRKPVVAKKPPVSPAARGTESGKPTATERGTEKRTETKKKPSKATAEKRATGTAKAAAEKRAAEEAERKAADKAEKRTAAATKAAAEKRAAEEAEKRAAAAAKAAAEKRAAEEAEKRAAAAANAAAEKRAAEEAEKRAAAAAKAAAEKRVAEEAKKRAAAAAKAAAEKRAAEEAEKRAAAAAKAAAEKRAAEEAEKRAAAAALAKTEKRTLSKLSLKIHPKIKSAAFFLLEIAFDVFVGWLDNKRVQKMIERELAQNDDKLQKVLDSDKAQDDFVKFRTGDKLEKGYQLYFKINLFITRTCSDGGCGTSGSISDVYFKEVSFCRNKGREIFPDATDEDGWDTVYNNMYGAIATFYTPLFDKGEKIVKATEDAADKDFKYFTEEFIDRKSKGMGDYQKEYFYEFRKYALTIQDSEANKIYNLRWGMNEPLVDLTMVELAKQDPSILLSPPNNMAFDEVLEKVRWGLASKMGFIVYYYNEVIKLDDKSKIYYLELYDKYFKLIDDGYTKCNSSCHRGTGDRRIIHRVTPIAVKMKHALDLNPDPAFKISKEEQEEYEESSLEEFAKTLRRP